MKIQRKKTLKRISRRKSISRRKRQSKPISRRKRYSRKMKGGNPFCGKYKRDIARLINENTKLKEELKPLENTVEPPAKRSPIYHTLHTPHTYVELLPTNPLPQPNTPSFHTTPNAGPNAPTRNIVNSPSRPFINYRRGLEPVSINFDDVSSA
jgi:hypothetical protein